MTQSERDFEHIRRSAVQWSDTHLNSPGIKRWTLKLVYIYLSERLLYTELKIQVVPVQISDIPIDVRSDVLSRDLNEKICINFGMVMDWSTLFFPSIFNRLINK